MPEPSPDALAHFAEQTTLTSEAGTHGDAAVRYRLMTPVDAAAGRRYPLVIFLHGAGESGQDNRLQLRYLPEILARPENRKRYPCYALAMQCPADDKWVQVDWGQIDWQPPTSESRALRKLRAAIAAVERTKPIDDSRIYLTGLSMGGFGAWALAASEPSKYAALAPLCGGGDPHRAAAMTKLPIWAVHGELDDAVPVEQSRRMIAALQAAGGNPKYSELAGVGHDCWTPAYAPEFGLLDWMFAQRREAVKP